MPRILVIQLKRIGDLILTAPAMAALRAGNAGAEIVMLVQEGCEALATNLCPVDQIYGWKAGRPNLGICSAIKLGEWDLALDFTGTDRSAALTWLSGAKTRRGYAKFAAKWTRKRSYNELCEASVRDLHTVDFHLALVKAAVVEYVPPLPSVDLPELPERFALVHIGTAREEKFWPADRWVEVITHLVQAVGLPVVLTGTNQGLEKSHLDRIRSALTVPFLDLTGKLTLVQTAGVVSRASVALGVDSMAMHLAATFLRPQVVLFGPTNPHHWRPRHTMAITLAAGSPSPVQNTLPKAKGQPMELISTEAVIDAISRLIPLIPSKCPTKL